MIRACVAVWLAAWLGAAFAHAHRPRTVHEAEVRALMTAFARDWNSDNPQAMSAYYQDHADFISPAGRRAHGRMEIEKLFQDEHSTIFKGSKMTVAVESVRFLRHDLVEVDAAVTIDELKHPDGSPRPPLKLHLVEVLNRRHDRWKVVSTRPYAFVGK